jgi:hypothetical protein
MPPPVEVSLLVHRIDNPASVDESDGVENLFVVLLVLARFVINITL